jgi:acetoin utilization protein AcuC
MASSSDGPLLVFGPRSTTYDFGPHHPLTPLRFGPGIDLLRHVGAEPGLAPEPAADEELEWVHSRRYVDAVRRYGDEPWLPADYGFGHSDNPAFPGMHEAAASVAGGSSRAMEAILRGDVLHAHHPGGGLHHAMPERASGFCIYDDPAVAIARARRAGLRVLYLDVDVHHGDGVQAMFYDDPGALTISIHESGRYLFPGTGFPDELGVRAAAGTSVNLPFEPFAGEGAWLGSLLEVVPPLAASFGPDVVVSQHGADAHAWDPLAHLRVTTTAQWEVAKLVDAVAHRYAGGRWLATGGGGYAAYRVVPRTWALTWLAGAHREPPVETPPAWRSRWQADAAAFGDAPLPSAFLDTMNAGIELSDAQGRAERASAERAIAVRDVVVPALVRAAWERGWWRPALPWPGEAPGRSDAASPSGAGSSTIVPSVDPGGLAGLQLAPRVVSPAEPAEAHELLLAALGDPGTLVTVAVDGSVVVGAAVSAVIDRDPRRRELLALGVAPSSRRGGLAGRLLAEHLALEPDATWSTTVTVAERDWIEPLDVDTRASIVRRLLERAGFDVRPAPPAISRIDPWAVHAQRRAG